MFPMKREARLSHASKPAHQISLPSSEKGAHRGWKRLLTGGFAADCYTSVVRPLKTGSAGVAVGAKTLELAWPPTGNAYIHFADCCPLGTTGLIQSSVLSPQRSDNTARLGSARLGAASQRRHKVHTFHTTPGYWTVQQEIWSCHLCPWHAAQLSLAEGATVAAVPDGGGWDWALSD